MGDVGVTWVWWVYDRGGWVTWVTWVWWVYDRGGGVGRYMHVVGCMVHDDQVCRLVRASGEEKRAAAWVGI